MDHDDLLTRLERLADAATPGGRYGRSEYITVQGARMLVWALYSGEERDGYVNKMPIIWANENADAAFLRYAANPQTVKALVAVARAAENVNAKIPYASDEVDALDEALKAIREGRG